MNLINRILSHFDLKLVRASALKNARNKEWDLDQVPKIEIPNEDISKLRSTAELSLKSIFNGDEELQKAWESTEKEFQHLNIPDGSGGVNPGDRRAVFYLIYWFKPLNVLEVGTHIGTSTIHMASALDKGVRGQHPEASLTTIDIRDVNDEEEAHWEKFNVDRSPGRMVQELGFDGFVDFKVGRSIDHLERTDDRYDLIFLDGDHSAETVYMEIPSALKALREGGLILLHDYYPGLEPLWEEQKVIPGPYLAVQRHIKEGADLSVHPLGELPWSTKEGAKKTSLAILTRP